MRARKTPRIAQEAQERAELHRLRVAQAEADVYLTRARAVREMAEADACRADAEAARSRAAYHGTTAQLLPVMLGELVNLCRETTGPKEPDPAAPVPSPGADCGCPYCRASRV